MTTENTIEVEEIEPEESGRRHLAWIVAGAVVVIALFTLLPPAGNSLPSEALPATLPPPPTVAEQFEISTPIAVAAAFVDAYGSFDVDRAASFLAAEAEVSRLEGGHRHWRLDNRWLEAVGFKLDLVSCESVESSASGVRVRCGYAFHALGSEEHGEGPFDGSFDLRVREGRIDWAFQTWHESPFSETVWRRFKTWVAEAYPSDVEVMYAGGSTPRFTKESIVHWEERSHEYAVLGEAAAAYRLRVREICRAATARFEEAWKAAQVESIDAVDESQAWMKIAAPIMEDALRKLREVPSPETVRALFERDYALLEKENEWLRLVGAGINTEPPPGGAAAHYIQPSLQECTSGG